MESIKVLARRARKITEKFATKHPTIGSAELLDCFCAIGSWVLFILAEKEGYSPIFIEGTYIFDGDTYDPKDPDLNHCWVQINKIDIDITATQFGYPNKISLRRANVRDKFIAANKYREINHLNFFLNEWKDQNPAKYEKELLALIQEYS